jgi:hypothetical protein
VSLGEQLSPAALDPALVKLNSVLLRKDRAAGAALAKPAGGVARP